jgi:hypothetical protein
MHADEALTAIQQPVDAYSRLTCDNPAAPAPERPRPSQLAAVLGLHWRMGPNPRPPPGPRRRQPFFGAPERFAGLRLVVSETVESMGTGTPDVCGLTEGPAARGDRPRGRA